MLNIGDKAPDFTLEGDDGNQFTLSAAGEAVLLVFYPGDDTPVCTAQLCDYRDNIQAFRGLGVRVVGLSKDGRESHIKFKEKHKLPFALLSDTDLSVAEKYGARGMMGGMKRAVVLVDKGGAIRYLHVEAVSLFKRSSEELKDVLEGLKAEGTL